MIDEAKNGRCKATEKSAGEVLGRSDEASKDYLKLVRCHHPQTVWAIGKDRLVSIIPAPRQGAIAMD